MRDKEPLAKKIDEIRKQMTIWFTSHTPSSNQITFLITSPTHLHILTFLFLFLNLQSHLPDTMKLKHISLLVVVLLVLLPLVCKGRPEPSDPKSTSSLDQVKVDEARVEKCEVGEGEEECLIRRTLVAHTDYIYTQGKHN
ncbi:Phytosulfokine [Rhynchospora pubera]|uniref:Phytosulfokine n=1 Tax=Rhynchospora pubera TaxID=906938 RepID=A0AAV8C6Z4_9POAL|nr:Phytosulfokine [Rhynchospora pubera]